MGEQLIAFTTSATLVVGIFLVWAIALTHAKMDRLERKVSLLLRHAGMDVEEIACREARELLKAGKKIAAIKLYRDYTGARLSEAKKAVERLQTKE